LVDGGTILERLEQTDLGDPDRQRMTALVRGVIGDPRSP
jgi:hypothetical protein